MSNIYWATLRRSTLSAVYTFGGLHLLIVLNLWTGWYGIWGLLLSPAVGLFHGFMMWLVVIVIDRDKKEPESRSRFGYFTLCAVIGGFSYTLGVIVLTSLTTPVHIATLADPETNLLREAVSDPVCWIAFLVGGIAGGRLGKWVLQEIG